jgi:hypothetical protein
VIEFRAVQDGERTRDARVMSSVHKVCRKCGAEILADAPEGLCTACLFETGLGLLLDGPVAAGDDGGCAENVKANAAAPDSHSKKAARADKIL